MKIKVEVEETPDPTVLSEDALWCRAEGHNWGWMRDTDIKESKAFERHSMCQRCGLMKSRVISLTTFQVIARHGGKYPPNYLVRGGRLTKADVLREQYGRSKKRRRS